ncbi:hypothetical protein [Polynucleobacter sp.]|uniref:hypothetical protein n=1 Tax=Polynucleobacter sp. TaxID=2029855 RepID=UPI003F6A209D
MKIFKNRSFKKRDYETSNIVYAVTDDGKYPETVSGDWEQTDLKEMPENINMLWKVGNTRLWGYL